MKKNFRLNLLKTDNTKPTSLDLLKNSRLQDSMAKSVVGAFTKCDFVKFKLSDRKPV